MKLLGERMNSITVCRSAQGRVVSVLEERDIAISPEKADLARKGGPRSMRITQPPDCQNEATF
jgi:hypothetical protein